MLFCSSIAFAENDLTTENETDKELESVEVEAPAAEAVNYMATEVAPQYYGNSNSSSFDYHKYIDAIYVNYGIIDGNHQFLGFDVGKDFFLDFNRHLDNDMVFLTGFTIFFNIHLSSIDIT